MILGAFKAEIDGPKDNLFIIFRIERGDHGPNWSYMGISLETNMTDETMKGWSDGGIRSNLISRSEPLHQDLCILDLHRF